MFNKDEFHKIVSYIQKYFKTLEQTNFSKSFSFLGLHNQSHMQKVKEAFQDPSFENISNWERGVSKQRELLWKFPCLLIFHTPINIMIVETRLIITFALLAFMDHRIFLFIILKDEWRQANLLQIVPVHISLEEDWKASFSLTILFYTKKMKWLNSFLFGFILANAIIESVKPINDTSG